MKHFQNIAKLVIYYYKISSTFKIIFILVNINDSYAFVCKDVSRNKIAKSEWSCLDWGKEFERQGVSDNWKESNFNTGYTYCDTYPERLWIPKPASSQTLIGSCRFRSRARLPVLTYFYKHNGASICR